jgi:hypothetical protein
MMSWGTLDAGEKGQNKRDENIFAKRKNWVVSVDSGCPFPYRKPDYI